MRLLLSVMLLSAPLISAELTEQDKQNISYIINTLSGKSVLGLALYQGKLEEAGKKTKSIHPLTFLGYMYANESLRNKIPKITPFAWKRFKKDFFASLNRSDIGEKQIDAFTQQTGLAKEKVAPLIQEKKWNELFSLLFGSTQ